MPRIWRLDPEKEADAFVDAEKGVASAEEALAGARDIMAEWMSEDAEARSRMRALFQSEGVLRSKARPAAPAGKAAKAEAEKDAGKFRDYLDWSEPISRTSSHRLLAMLRGERTGALSLHVAPAEEDGLAVLEELFIKGDGPASRPGEAGGTGRLSPASCFPPWRMRLSPRRASGRRRRP